MKLAIVVDADRRLLGVISDGDIRRAILQGNVKELRASGMMNPSPVTIRDDASIVQIKDLMRVHSIQRIPVLDEARKVVGLKLFEEIYEPAPRENWVLLMAGGIGSRLSPLTDDTPKPLLRVGGKPILESILENCSRHGFKRFYISVNYKAEMIKAYFQNGSKWGVQIEYLEEGSRLGTAGALALLPRKTEFPLVVLNGDLLTNVDLDKLLDFHRTNQATATMGVKEFDFQVPYGVIKTNGVSILGIDEKPVHRVLVNAGIYAISPEALPLVPAGQPFNMTDLFSKVLEQTGKACAFPIHEYWLDIGKMKDFEQAQVDAGKIIPSSE